MIPLEERRKRVDVLAEAVRKNPGKRPGTLSAMLGWGPSVARDVLMVAEEVGVLFWEDDRGGVYLVED